MNAHAKAWIEALRSGEFKQGGGQLHTRTRAGDRNHYCCLGVACVLAARDGVVTADTVFAGTGVSYDGAAFFLPLAVARRLGLRGGAGEAADDAVMLPDGTSLAALNDAGTPFAEIADIIEDNAEWLFEEES